MNFIRSFRKIQKMEGRFLAVSASVIIWIISYIISLRYFSHKFTNEVKILDSKEKADIKMLTMLSSEYLFYHQCWQAQHLELVEY